MSKPRPNRKATSKRGPGRKVSRNRERRWRELQQEQEFIKENINNPVIPFVKDRFVIPPEELTRRAEAAHSEYERVMREEAPTTWPLYREVFGLPCSNYEYALLEEMYR